MFVVDEWVFNPSVFASNMVGLVEDTLYSIYLLSLSNFAITAPMDSLSSQTVSKFADFIFNLGSHHSGTKQQNPNNLQTLMKKGMEMHSFFEGAMLHVGLFWESGLLCFARNVFIILFINKLDSYRPKTQQEIELYYSRLYLNNIVYLNN